MSLRDAIFIVGVLIGIALASTVSALTLQRYVDRSIPLIAVGQALAALGASIFAYWLRRKR